MSKVFRGHLKGSFLCNKQSVCVGRGVRGRGAVPHVTNRNTESIVVLVVDG